MKNADLIKKLQEFPLDMEVCIFDIAINEQFASEEPNTNGVYQEISIYKMYEDAELKELKQELPTLKNFIALQFENEFVNEIPE